MSSSTRKPAIHIAWTTVTYRSVALMVLAGVGLCALGMRLAFPEFSASGIKAASGAANRVLQKVAGMAPPAGSGVTTAQQAHFTALDGTVRVKKGSSSSWLPADYNVPLDKGDVVQTGSEGMAKVVFNDGTSYTVKQDSLIVIEENSANDQQQTNVAVAVSTGTVDLSTATYSQGSKSQVIVDGATASLSPESTAQVHNDPKTDQHEILMKKGAGEVTRNGETVQLANWEKVSFQAAAPHMEKAKGTGPPTPISPANMAPIFTSGEATKDVEFSWTAMANATGYRFAYIEESLFFFYTGGQESEHSRRHRDQPRRRCVLLGGAVLRGLRKRVDGERKESLHHHSQRQAERSHRPGTRSFHSARTCNRSNRQDPDRRPRDGKRAGGADDLYGWYFPLLHTAAADRRGRNFCDGADSAGRSEYAAEENHYSVGRWDQFRAGRIFPEYKAVE